MAGSVISEDLVIEGDIDAKDGSISVRGRVKGNITAREVEVLDGGTVNGIVSADKVGIHGKHSGSIKCAELSLHSTSEVKSDVTAKTMSSEKGARLAGKVEITG